MSTKVMEISTLPATTRTSPAQTQQTPNVAQREETAGTAKAEERLDSFELNHKLFFGK